MLRQDLRESIVAQNQQNSLMERSLSILENLRDEIDPSMKDWIPSGSNYDSTQVGKLQSVNLQKLIDESRVSYYTNPHGRNIIRTLVKFVVGSGVMVDFLEKDEKKLEILVDFWDDLKKQIKWVSFVREYVRRLFRDGEVLLRRFDPKDDKPLIVRFLEPNLISDDDIILDKDDRAVVVSYRVNKVEVPAEKVHHLKADVDQNVKRGRPILEPILPYLTKYGRWLDARMVLNIVRASVTIVQEVQGSSADLLRLSNKNTSNRNTPSNDKSKMVRPGTIIRGTPGVKYNMLSPNLDARDAAEDGRTILLAVAASAGFPDVYVTADYSGANFASTVTAQNPAIREFEDWQEFIAEGMSDVINWFLDDAKERNMLPENIDTRFNIGFPPLLKRDMAQENAAYNIMNDKGVASKRTWGIKMGLNPDQEKKFIADEGGPSQPISGKTPQEPPKRVDDRQPRQGNVGARTQKQTQVLSKKPRAFRVIESRKDGNRHVTVEPMENSSGLTDSSGKEIIVTLNQEGALDDHLQMEN